MGAGLATVCSFAGAVLEARRRAKDELNDDEAIGTVHMIVIALDYPGTGNELTCTKDGDNMMQLAQACGVQDIEKLYNNEGNKDNVLRAIEEVGGRCGDGDYFIFYYSGHGANVPDKDGDEEDGQDESLCLVTPDGRIDWNGFLTDDDFADAVTENVSPGVKVLIMCDCCHSGTIGDFGTADGWDEFKAISFSGCADDQTSGDTGNGGIFTHSLLMAIQDMQESDETEYSVAQLYNKVLERDDEVFHSDQDIKLKWTKALGDATCLAWPLVPQGDYQAPWGR